MSTLQSIVDTHNDIVARLPEGSLGAGSIETVTGQISAHGALNRQALQSCLDQFKPAGGWLQYQGRVVRPQDFDFADGIRAEHPEWGLLLDAELFGPGDQPASLTIRFDGEHWQASEWQPGSGEECLCESVERRGLGRIRFHYIRLWHEQGKELRATSAWLVGIDAQGKGEQE